MARIDTKKISGRTHDESQIQRQQRVHVHTEFQDPSKYVSSKMMHRQLVWEKQLGQAVDVGYAQIRSQNTRLIIPYRSSHL